MTDIIVPTYGNEEYTIKCFKSLRDYCDIPYRLIWVDNGSTKASRDIVMNEIIKHKNYKSVWLEENTGFVVASNIGLNLGNSERVVLLNNDTEITPGLFSGMEKILKSDNQIACVGPVTMGCNSWQSIEYLKKTQNMNADIDKLKTLNHSEISDYFKNNFSNIYLNAGMLAFFCTMFDRKKFKEINYLPTVYDLGLGDDDESCFLLRKLGYKVVFTPSLFCYHNHRTTFKKLFSEDELKKLQKENIELFKERCKNDKSRNNNKSNK